MKNVDQVIRAFRDRGYKVTPQRIAILEVLEGNKTHPSADDIYVSLRRKHPTMSFTTVYNTLETLKELGEIQELTIDQRRLHYDPDITLHHHIMCTQCGHIDDIFADYTQAIQVPEEILRRFHVNGHSVQFYGLCSYCQDHGDA